MGQKDGYRAAFNNFLRILRHRTAQVSTKMKQSSIQMLPEPSKFMAQPKPQGWGGSFMPRRGLYFAVDPHIIPSSAYDVWLFKIATLSNSPELQAQLLQDLEENPSFFAQDNAKQGPRAAHYAAKKGAHKLLKKLYECKADCCSPAQNSLVYRAIATMAPEFFSEETPLDWALKSDTPDLETLEFLLKISRDYSYQAMNKPYATEDLASKLFDRTDDGAIKELLQKHFPSLAPIKVMPRLK